jgi:hypothetical protein
VSVRAGLPGLLCLVLLAPALCWNGDPTPHDDQHLIILRPEPFRTTEGKPAPTAPDDGAVFDGKAVQVLQPVRADVRVQLAGDYTLWVRVGQDKDVQTPLRVVLPAAGGKATESVIHKGPGSAGCGGEAGFKAYQKVALKTMPDGKVEEDGLGIAVGGEKDKDGELGEEEMLGALGEKKSTWVNMLRVENPAGKRPFYWWKAGTVHLEPGECRLEVQPLEPPPEGKSPLLDAAFLTTFDKLVYPFSGDISAPRSSYIRFRLAQVPEEGVRIGASIRVHYDPWGTGQVWLTPSGQTTKAAEPHRKSGFTRWYRLQDIENAPGMGGGVAHLLLSVAPESAIQGATQFAVWPHQDQVLREIRWDEPEGLRVSMAPDFENYLHCLRTFRDHAREEYEWALGATGGQLFPLTRGPLYFGNAWGAADGSPYDFMVKTLRLLGFNCAGAPHDAVRSRNNYGWTPVLHAFRRRSSQKELPGPLQERVRAAEGALRRRLYLPDCRRTRRDRPDRDDLAAVEVRRD